jgi:hypothetical protein
LYNAFVTTSMRVKFDGKVLVPEGPVDLPVGPSLEVRIAEPPSPETSAPLALLAELAENLPPRNGPPTDRAAQHDHYLYGTPKRP